MNIKGGEK